MGRCKERIEPLAGEIDGFAVEADVADEATVRRAVDEAADSSGGLDAMLNLAGVQLLAPFSDGRSDEWRTLLDVNVFGSCVVIPSGSGAPPGAGGGDIVNMSSIAGRRVTGSDGAVYSGTKLGNKARATREGIRVMIVSPGPRTQSSDRTWPTRRSGTNSRSGRRRSVWIPGGLDARIVHALAQPWHLMLHEIASMAIGED